jgi:hypothetical protein
VLKKAGIVVATAAAGLLAVSPLAFAGDKGDHEDHDGNGDKKRHSSHDSRYEHNNNGDKTLVEQRGDGGNNACSNTQLGDFDATGGNGLLSLIPILNGVNALDQVNALQCVNVLNNNLNDNDLRIGILGDNSGNRFEVPRN